jgi:hypothetical protein
MRKFLVAAMVAVAVLTTTRPADAAFNIQAYDDGVLFSTTVIPLTPTMWSISGSSTDFTFGGTAQIQLVGNGTLSVSYNNAVTQTTNGTHTLTLLVSNQGYMLPTGTVVKLSSSGGGSYIGLIGDSVVGTTLGFLDPNNALFGQVTVAGDGTVAANAHSTPASTTGSIPGTAATVPLVYTPPTATNLVASAVPFSLTNVTVFTFTGQIGDTANISNSVATSATPAPAALVLALTGIPVLGCGAWLRRRRPDGVTAA